MILPFWKCLIVVVIWSTSFVFQFVHSVDVSMKSNAVTYVKSRVPEQHSVSDGRRWRRATISQQEIDSMTNMHNKLRRQEGSSDMEQMKWNKFLASMAKEWAERCDFDHGQPYREPSKMPFDSIGQNLYATTGKLDSTDAIKSSWYDEKPWYNYDTLQCKAGEQCGHYTQVVWASSREIGCAYALCPDLRSTTFGRANYLVCNYGPAGNYEGQKPYKKGKACSKCSAGGSWCNDGLCNRDCKESGTDCVCAANCQNCGVVIQETCTCSCAPGWHGTDCSAECRNTNTNCNANPGWPPSWCNHVEYGATIRQSCPAMCGLCKVSNETITCSSSSSQYQPTYEIQAMLITTLAYVALTS